MDAPLNVRDGTAVTSNAIVLDDTRDLLAPFSFLGRQDHMSSKLLSAFVLVAVVSGCAKSAPPESAPSPSGSIMTADAQPVAPEGRRDRDVITKDEMTRANVGSQSVLDVVSNLRPAFLNVRGLHNVAAAGGDPEAGKVHGSIDGNKLISVEELRGVLAATVKEIRFLNPAAAMQRFGGSAREGPVILVTTM